MIRILIADDHAIVRAGLKQFIADQVDMEVAAEAARELADHRMVVLEHSAHWPQWEAAALFDRAHLEFLLA